MIGGAGAIGIEQRGAGVGQPGIGQLEVGQRYFVYVTNTSGLYRYEMNDIVEVTGHHRQTPLIRFVQKGKGVVSFTGEKLYEVQVIAAVDKALAALRGRYHFIAAVAELVDGTNPRLIFLIEFDDEITEQDGSVLVDRVDVALGEENDEYLTKRKSLRYGAPVIRVVRPGASTLVESTCSQPFDPCTR